MDYREWISTKVAPGFWRRKWGRLLMETVGDALDLALNAAKWAVKVRFPSTAPEDALGYVGDGRNFDRYRVETDTEAFRTALMDSRRQWETAGTKGDNDTGLINKFRRLGYLNVQIYGWREAQAFVPGITNTTQTASYANWWSAFFVAIHPNPFTKRKWGDPGLKWGMRVPSPVGNPDDVITWGSSANSSDVKELRRVLRKWKPAHEICPYVIFRANGSTDVFSTSNVYIGTR
jgi:hypothetical protein